jgi:hypothetical protein
VAYWLHNSYNSSIETFEHVLSCPSMEMAERRDWRNIGEAHAGLYKTVRKLVTEDCMSVLKPFFDIEQFETRTKKYVHFKTDGISVSVLLGEECKPKPKACKTKRK